MFIEATIPTFPQAFDQAAGALEIDFTPIGNDLIQAAEFRLRELAEKLGIDAPHVALDGSVADCIRDEAVRRNADLIVTGRGQAQAAVGGIWSQVYPIVRESPCPVLSI